MKIFKNQTKTIHIIEDDSTPSFQQTLLLDQKKQVIEMALSSNQHLDSKIIAVLQAAAVAISLVGVLSVPDFVQQSANITDKVLIGLSFASFVALLIVTLWGTWPRKYSLPGTQDWQEMWDLYQSKKPDDCYYQILNDYANSITKLQKANNRKANALVIAALLLMIQTSLVVATVIF